MFFRKVLVALELRQLQKELIREKEDSIKSKEQPVKVGVIKSLRRKWIRCLLRSKKFFQSCYKCPKRTGLYRFSYKLRHDGSCENYTAKSVLGFLCGFIMTYIFFMFFVFQLNFKLSSATILCSFLGCILTIGLAFSPYVRCIVLLLVPQFFTKRGRQALLAYAFILAITGPAKNTLNNMSILSESLACGQEQLKAAIKQIIEVLKVPFFAIRDAIKKVVKAVKEIIKKIKKILLAIKRVVITLAKVIKAAFNFLRKIVSVCNKELGTPFERCSRVFENAISDCHAKLGPLFSWLCSITYIVKSVCYIVKIYDLVCLVVDFIDDSVVGVLYRKIKLFVKHIRTMFYVRIKFSHAYHFESTQSKSMKEVYAGIVTEVKKRSEGLMAIFDLMTCATSLFFLFIVVRVIYYRYKFLTNERFDNRFITRDFRVLDMRRAQMEKETLLPLNHREAKRYINPRSLNLVYIERLQLSKSVIVLLTATIKLTTHMLCDYCLYWMLMLIRKHAAYQSKIKTPSLPQVHISGTGFLADLLSGIVNAFKPLGIELDIDTIPCLPDPIPPDYDRYIQIGTCLLLCWVLTVLEPYGLRLRHAAMCYYHPVRAKERTIWLYNHILRRRSSFLKFARRQLRRRLLNDKSATKVTCKEYIRARINNPLILYCIGSGQQDACMLCGEVFRDQGKVIRCATPGCKGMYCERCFTDLQNICTICLDPIQYGDLSDIDVERDSSAEEDQKRALEKRKKKKSKKKKKKKGEGNDDDDDDDDDSHKKDDDDDDGTSGFTETDDETTALISDLGYDTVESSPQEDSPTEPDSDYSYTYQLDKDIHAKQDDLATETYKDLEQQRIPDYASMETFNNELKGDPIETEVHMAMIVDNANDISQYESAMTLTSDTKNLQYFSASDLLKDRGDHAAKGEFTTRFVTDIETEIGDTNGPSRFEEIARAGSSYYTSKFGVVTELDTESKDLPEEVEDYRRDFHFSRGDMVRDINAATVRTAKNQSDEHPAGDPGVPQRKDLLSAPKPLYPSGSMPRQDASSSEHQQLKTRQTSRGHRPTSSPERPTNDSKTSGLQRQSSSKSEYFTPMSSVETAPIRLSEAKKPREREESSNSAALADKAKQLLRNRPSREELIPLIDLNEDDDNICEPYKTKVCVRCGKRRRICTCRPHTAEIKQKRNVPALDSSDDFDDELPPLPPRTKPNCARKLCKYCYQPYDRCYCIAECDRSMQRLQSLVPLPLPRRSYTSRSPETTPRTLTDFNVKYSIDNEIDGPQGGKIRTKAKIEMTQPLGGIGRHKTRICQTFIEKGSSRPQKQLQGAVRRTIGDKAKLEVIKEEVADAEKAAKPSNKSTQVSRISRHNATNGVEKNRGSSKSVQANFSDTTKKIPSVSSEADGSESYYSRNTSMENQAASSRTSAYKKKVQDYYKSINSPRTADGDKPKAADQKIDESAKYIKDLPTNQSDRNFSKAPIARKNYTVAYSVGATYFCQSVKKLLMGAKIAGTPALDRELDQGEEGEAAGARTDNEDQLTEQERLELYDSTDSEISVLDFDQLLDSSARGGMKGDTERRTRKSGKDQAATGDGGTFAAETNAQPDGSGIGRYLREPAEKDDSVDVKVQKFQNSTEIRNYFRQTPEKREMNGYGYGNNACDCNKAPCNCCPAYDNGNYNDNYNYFNAMDYQQRGNDGPQSMMPYSYHEQAKSNQMQSDNSYQRAPYPNNCHQSAYYNANDEPFDKPPKPQYLPQDMPADDAAKHKNYSYSSPEVANRHKQQQAAYYNPNNEYPGAGSKHEQTMAKYPDESSSDIELYKKQQQLQAKKRYKKQKACPCCNRTLCEQDEQESLCSDNSRHCEYMDLAYQQQGDYPNLVDELEDTITQRNRERVQKTLQHFEMISSGVKAPSAMDAPDKRYNNGGGAYEPCPCQKCSTKKNYNRPCFCTKGQCQFCDKYCKQYQQKCEPLCRGIYPQQQANYPHLHHQQQQQQQQQASSYLKSGYVEKVVRNMDPNLNESLQRYPKFQGKFNNTHWKYDPRSGEWNKVRDHTYDYDNNYPPLPPPPPSNEQIYDVGNERRQQRLQHYMANQEGYMQQQQQQQQQQHQHKKNCMCSSCCMHRENARRY